MAKDDKPKDDKAKTPAPARKDEPAAAPAKKKGRMTRIVVIAGATALLLAAGSGAAWYYLRPAHGEKAAAPGKAAPKRAEKPRPALFVALETFTVNLQQENGDHYLQTTLTLKVADAAVEQSVKQQMPEIRSRLLLLLSSKRPSELTAVEGKQALANQIAGEVNAVLDPGAAAAAPAGSERPVLSVLFTNFIIQ
jgi:flagellar FliL protein